ncbi:MAG: putative entry exclusion protein TrbK-alt [Sphingobium sp.]
MSRIGKIAGIAALAGMMLAIGILCLRERPAPSPEIVTIAGSKGDEHLASELDRCATLTMPDSGCEAAWAANRRRFFRQDDHKGVGP